MRKWKRSGDRLARHSGAARSLRPRQQNDSIIAQANSCRQIRWIAGSAGACRWLRLSLLAGSAKLLGNQRFALLPQPFRSPPALRRCGQRFALTADFAPRWLREASWQSALRFAACCDCQPSALSLPASVSPLRSARSADRRFRSPLTAAKGLRQREAPRQREARASRCFLQSARI